MNSLTRFFTLGAQDADRRVASLLAPRPGEPADAYLMSSAVFRAIDRITRHGQMWWSTSDARRTAAATGRTWSGYSWAVRYRAIGSVLLGAVGVHVALTMIQGPRPGWFWLVIPGMVFAFSLLLLVVSASTRSFK